MHLEHTTHALFMAFDRVDHGISGIKHTAIDAHEGQRAIIVGDDFECKACKFTIRSTGTTGRKFSSTSSSSGGAMADTLNLIRRRKVINHRVKKGLDAFVFEGCAT